MPQSADIEMRLLLEAVYAKYSHDFRDYSGASLKRRVLHAMRQLGCATVSELQSRVLHDPEVFQELLETLTIPFTEMFPTRPTGRRCAATSCPCCAPTPR